MDISSMLPISVYRKNMNAIKYMQKSCLPSRTWMFTHKLNSYLAGIISIIIVVKAIFGSYNARRACKYTLTNPSAIFLINYY